MYIETLKPHVLTKAEALRNVDVFLDFESQQELDSYIMACVLIGVGSNAVVFLTPKEKGVTESEMLLRLEIQNPLGCDWTEELLVYLRSKYTRFSTQLDDLITKLNTMLRVRSLQTQAKNCRKSINNQIAGHNSAFRRDPLITMPINSYFTYKGDPLALRVKYLRGDSLSEVDPKAQLAPAVVALMRGDSNPSNLIVNISNSQLTKALIDIWNFLPSSDALQTTNGEEVYLDKEELYIKTVTPT